MQQDESGRIGEMERKGPEEKCNLLFVAEVTGPKHFRPGRVDLLLQTKYGTCYCQNTIRCCEQASTDLTALRGTQLLKTELDVQEQRLWDLQRELQESQQELQRGHDRNQQLHGQLQDARKKDQELQAQKAELQELVC
ncbi:hypothetical protein PO909_023345 [Leuciscus waleckii]